MSTRWITFGVWAAVAALAWSWGPGMFVDAPPLPRDAQFAEIAEMGSETAWGDITRPLGVSAPPAPPAEAEAPVAGARFQLIGVISPSSTRAAREGLALIAVGGKPPEAFRVGALVEGESVLQAVGPRSARLGPQGGATLLVLSLALPAAPATDMLQVSGMRRKLSNAAAPGGILESLPPPTSVSLRSAQSPAPALHRAYQTEQQIFHQRQQLQFQQEQMQNQGPHPLETPPLPNADPPAERSKLR